MSTILAGGVVFGAQDYLEDPLPAQHLLELARSKHGHALCLCVTPHRQLVIREIKKVLYLAVWPNDGHHHDPACEFFRDTPGEAEPKREKGVGPEKDSQTRARSALLPAARVNADGKWDVNIDLPKQRGNVPPSSAAVHSSQPHQPGSISRPSRNSLSLQQFLSWMWDSTSMVRWATGWRRDWWRVSRAIRTEAEAVTVRGQGLNDLLYIPPPFRMDREAEIQAEWQAFVQPLNDSAAHGQPKRGFLLVEIKVVDRTEYGYKFQARNLARPIFIDEHLHAQITKQAPLALAHLPRLKENKLKCSVIALIVVEATSKGNLRALDATLMLTNDHYIPVTTIYELELANELCQADRTFTRGVGKHVGADFVLRDTQPPTAMVISSLHSSDYVRQRDDVIEECQRNGCDIWHWQPTPGQPMPDIPAPSQR